ncbi:protein-cysteine N-palmitoyltransferase HHAT [Bufo gargarizans]|uniref:protein-cysteine N-palmitoyltransferase HHAT n=1 Tax=Bufo gargarizans TaxID=30331 RepID=UPI001CF5A874|nr:protein-cysteine N-palmitoyltransferase HHAT [Bufo gargarizans]
MNGRGQAASHNTMKHDPLPKSEYYTYLMLSLGIHFYSFYKVYLSSKDQEEIIEQEVGLERDTSILGLKKDVSDFEWSFWMEWARSHLVWLMLGHALLSQFARIFFRKYHPWLLMVYGMVACWLVLGIKGLVTIFLNTLVFYVTAQMRTPIVTWLSSGFMLLLLHNESLEDIQRSWYGSENEFYLLQFTLTVRSLFYTSYCLEYSSLQASDDTAFSLPSLMLYVFYYPLFHNGPIITYDEFAKQIYAQDTRRPNFHLSGLVADISRLVLWWLLAELMIRTMYMHAMYSSYAVLEDVSYWTLGGLALAQVLFFYVKYLVLYGFPALIVQLDGVTAPALPRCVSTMYSFTGIWRCFDVGLHRFLVRYIYIPMGGSHSGLGGMLLSTASTFIFVSYWHGGHEYLWYWAALNWTGITVEYGLKKLLALPSLQGRIDQGLSPKTYRRLHAALASVSTALLILTNLVFLGGEQVGKIYWERLFVQGWPWIPLVMFGCLYCFTQVGIEWSLFLYPKYKGKFPLCSRTTPVK